jgi:hypothetical protein
VAGGHHEVTRSALYACRPDPILRKQGTGLVMLPTSLAIAGLLGRPVRTVTGVRVARSA